MRSWRSCAATTPILVDSNVILDLATVDSIWGQWSSATLARLVDEAVLVINPLSYAEISVDTSPWRSWKRLYRSTPSGATCSRTKPHFWPENASLNTAGEAANGHLPCRISTLVRMPRSVAIDC